MTDLISEVKAALQAATPGPWTMLDGRIYGKTMTAVEPLIHEFDDETIREVRNAHLIQHSPTWLQQLTDRLEEAVKALEEIDKACRKRTFNDCGDLRAVVYDIAFDTLKRIKGDSQAEGHQID